MVNTPAVGRGLAGGQLGVARLLVTAYIAVVALTVVVLGVLSTVAPKAATANAWGHAVVVAVFALVLPLRLRSARSGKRSAIRAVGLIAAVLLLVNVVEALIPGFVPLWMRVEMIAVAMLMGGVVFDVARCASRDH